MAAVFMATALVLASGKPPKPATDAVVRCPCGTYCILGLCGCNPCWPSPPKLVVR